MNGLRQDAGWFAKPGIWFWAALLLGLAVRLHLVVYTEGTTDVIMWEQHARDVSEKGMIGYYQGDRAANHPPFISEMESLLWRAANASGIPFRILLRAPFALLDAGTCFLLLLILCDTAWRFVIAAFYWLNPLGMILSAYHGNTDTALGFGLLLCVWLLSKGNLVAAAIALGVSLWIKLPAMLAIPALFFVIPDWRRRVLFLGVAGTVAISTYLPALCQDATIVYERVFGYRPQNLHTVSGIPTWGPRVVLFSLIAPAEKWPVAFRAPILFCLEHGWKLAGVLALVFSWLRRSNRSVRGLGVTIAGVYLIIYALSDGWSFQYFGWSLPFWFLLPAWFSIPAVTLVSAYFYFLYAYVCGNAWLLGLWDFGGHAYWPAPIIWIRNLAVVVFCAGAAVLFAQAIWDQRTNSRLIKDPGFPSHR